VSIAAAVAVSTVVIAWFVSARPTQRGAPDAMFTGAGVAPQLVAPAARTTTPDSDEVPAMAHSAAPPDNASKIAPLTLEQRLKQADDYRSFIDEIHDDATKGDPEAQYYLYVALTTCADGYRFYFDHRGRRRTLDEAMTRVAGQYGMSSDEVASIYRHCNRLMQEPDVFGNPRTWLEKSARRAYPVAQTVLAGRLYFEAEFGQNTQAITAAKAEEMRVDAKRLVKSALLTKDPAVLWNVSDLQFILDEDMDKANDQQWVWRLAACERGYDCSGTAGWHEISCRFDTNCQDGESGIDLIRRATASQFDSLDRQAKELNSKIDANEWAEIGLP
jgi:hypothetical protein